VSRLVVVAIVVSVATSGAEELPVRISGTVSERGTRAMLPAARVAAINIDGQVIADVEGDTDGKFALRLPADLEGPVIVVVTASEYRPLRVLEKLKAREALTVNYAVARTSYARYESTVKGRPPREEIGRVSLDGEEVRRIAGTKGDALQAVLNLPSVARSPFDIGQLVIRGSQPGESAAFVGGIQIPQVFHFGVGTSTFNSYLLERFDLIPSNFSVRYGRLTGGVVDIVAREAKRDRWHGDIKIDLYDAHLIVEGPISKKGSIALSVRRSYIDAVLGAVLPADTISVAPRYYDYQGMLDYQLGGGKLKITVFGADDELALVQQNPSENDPALAGRFTTRLWFHQLTASYKKSWKHWELESVLGVGGSHADAALGQAARFNLDVVRVDARLEVKRKITRTLKLTAGLDVLLDYFWVNLVAPSPPTEEQPLGPLAALDKKRLGNQGFEAYPAVYLQADWWIHDRLVVTPGVRVDWFDNKKGTFAQPRLMMRGRIAEETWLKAGAGLYYMPPQAPYDNAVLGNPAVRPTQAIHATLGLETRPLRSWRGLSIALNLFYKDIRNLAVASDGRLVRDGKIVPEVYSDEGVGRVYGGDLLIRQDTPKYVYGWIAYTLTRSERQDHPGDLWRPFQYDQTHILTIVLGTHLPYDIDLGLRFRLVSGNPQTSLLARNMTIFDADRDVHYPQPGAAFDERLPEFIQLDFRIDKRIIFKKWILAIYLDVTNVTNRANTEGWNHSYDYTRRAPVTGLPILPSLGLRATF
jgi:outer membrane receptor protein involved in Fe transport